MKRNLRPSHTNSFSRKPLLPRRPSATKHRPNRDPAAVDLFSTRIQESFFRAQMSAHIALRVHRLLDLPAFLLAAGADSEVHLSYLSGLLTLLSTSDRYVEEWVRVFYATVWIDPDHHWMRFCFE
jgi:hypothetical protein